MKSAERQCLLLSCWQITVASLGKAREIGGFKVLWWWQMKCWPMKGLSWCDRSIQGSTIGKIMSQCLFFASSCATHHKRTLERRMGTLLCLNHGKVIRKASMNKIWILFCWRVSESSNRSNNESGKKFDQSHLNDTVKQALSSCTFRKFWLWWCKAVVLSWNLRGDYRVITYHWLERAVRVICHCTVNITCTL